MTITHTTNENGYYFRYDHSPDESEETLEAVILMAAEVAVAEAQKSKKSHYVTATMEPTAIYILPEGHPELTMIAMTILFELTQDGKVIQRKRPARH